MKFFKDKSNNTYCMESDEGLPPVVEITYEEAEEINAKRRAEEFKKIPYAEKRLSEYTPVGDQLDALLKYINGDEEELEKIAELHSAIKLKYPKD